MRCSVGKLAGSTQVDENVEQDSALNLTGDWTCTLALSLQAVSDDGPIQIKTGNGFVRLCSDVDKAGAEVTDQALANIASCTGYIMGLKDGIDVMVAVNNKSHGGAEKGLICVPEDVTLGQEVHIVLKYIRANPEKAHIPTSMLATKALKEAFPCSTH
jgi:hypothetical protein